MKTGKVWRHVCTGMLAGGLMLPLSAGAENEPIKIQVTIENPQPTCTINVQGDSVRNLGVIERNTQEHPSFAIEADCGGYAITRIKASALNGTVSATGSAVFVDMGGVGTKTIRPRLSLKANGENVKFSSNNIYDHWFCIASAPGKNTCTITPVTQASNKTLPRSGSVLVAFTVDYL